MTTRSFILTHEPIFIIRLQHLQRRFAEMFHALLMHLASDDSELVKRCLGVLSNIQCIVKFVLLVYVLFGLNLLLWRIFVIFIVITAAKEPRE